MRFPILRSRLCLLACSFCIFTIGCQSASHTGNGALIGSGLGAATGAIIGHQTGNSGTGALIGAVAGGLGGALVGNAQDAREERDMAVAQANYSQQALQAERMALTNADIVKMSQNGLSAELITAAIQQRGGRFHTSPDDLIALNANGVDQRVISVMQSAAPLPVVSVPPTKTVIPVEREVVVTGPGPQVGVGIHIGRRPHRRWWHRRHHRRHHHHH